MTKISQEISDGDCKALEYAAHSIKGSISNFSAKKAFEAALRLEMIARKGELTDARKTYNELREEIKRLKLTLIALVRGNVQGENLQGTALKIVDI